MDARRVAEVTARASYGRLVAILAARYRDMAAAEDGLADAFASALATWPERGIPASPEAWLLTAARRALSNRFRHVRVHDAAVADILDSAADRHSELTSDWPDERLKLLFVCAHPAIDVTMRTPLMLQTVLGLDAERIGAAFLVAPKTMGQRLVRAKLKIKEAGLSYTVPGPDELTTRLEEVLAAVYAAYGAGWDVLDSDSLLGLTDEGIFLGRLLATLLPEQPEVLGLLALMLFCESRRGARRDASGHFVPLDAQDPTLWSRALIIEAEALLTRAAKAATFGRFQCEAAIQSVHAGRAVTGTTNHAALRVLYDLLLAKAPSIGVAVGRCAALADAGDLERARHGLDALDSHDVEGYQPYWVTRARLARLAGDWAGERGHLTRALGLTESAAVREFLQLRLDALV